MGSAYIGAPVSLAFQGGGIRSCSGRGHGALSSCMCQEAGLTTECGAMETGHVATSGTGDPECSVVSQQLPILPVVSCFSTCGFGEGFVSRWLWGPSECLLGSSDLPFFRKVSGYWAIEMSRSHHLALPHKGVYNVSNISYLNYPPLPPTVLPHAPSLDS
jgi:hypothetical protein